VKHLLLSAAFGLALAGAASAADPDEIKIWEPAGTADAAQEAANCAVLAAWFKDAGHPHWAKYMVPDFLNHDPNEPHYGAQALVDLMHRNAMRGGPRAGAGPTTPVLDRGLPVKFFVIADGDYVFVAHNPVGYDISNPPPGKDIGASVGGNLNRMKDGKITDWWYFRGISHPASGQPGADRIDITKGSTRRADVDGMSLIYSSGATDKVAEAANKKLVLAWLRDFWVDQDYDGWARYMRADFRDHDTREPAEGAQALADRLKARPDFVSDYAIRKGVAHPQLFLLAQGDLVFVGGAPNITDHYDPVAQQWQYGGNIIRVQDGKIAEWWRVGDEKSTPQ